MFGNPKCAFSSDALGILGKFAGGSATKYKRWKAASREIFVNLTNAETEKGQASANMIERAARIQVEVDAKRITGKER